MKKEKGRRQAAAAHSGDFWSRAAMKSLAS